MVVFIFGDSNDIMIPSLAARLGDSNGSLIKGQLHDICVMASFLATSELGIRVNAAALGEEVAV